jgi:glucan 1,3-beta-glucosidase
VRQTLDVLERLAERYGKHPALIGIEVLNEPHRSFSLRLLRNYYDQAYRIVRKHCGDTVAVVFHDSFRLHRWRRLGGPQYSGVTLDHHYYQAHGWLNRHLPLGRHLRRPGRFARTLQRLQPRHPIIIGEWSAALPARLLQDRDGPAVHRQFAEAQLRAFESTAGWIYWSYKTEGGGAWSYRDSVERGWLPVVPPVSDL